MSATMVSRFGGSGKKASSKRDWGLFFGGVLVFLIGLVVVAWPGLTLVMIATLAGAILAVSGVFDLVSYVRFRKVMPRAGFVLAQALCSIVLGAVFFIHPIIAAAVIPWVAGAFVIAYGIFAVVAAFRLRGEGAGWGLMLLNGIVAVLCGLSFVVLPATFAVFLGVFLMMRGVTMATFGLTAPRDVPFV